MLSKNLWKLQVFIPQSLSRSASGKGGHGAKLKTKRTSPSPTLDILDAFSVVHMTTTRCNKALADEHKNVTNLCTNLAIHQFMETIERKPGANGSFISEPCHPVHDALCVQFPLEPKQNGHVPKLGPSATHRRRPYFAKRIPLAGQGLVIPFEGSMDTFVGQNLNWNL